MVGIIQANDAGHVRTARPRIMKGNDMPRTATRPAQSVPAVATPPITLVHTDGKPQITRAPRTPVRTDVNPTDVTPAPASPGSATDAANVVALEKRAHAELRATLRNADKIAETLAELYVARVWLTHADSKGNPMSVKAYFRDLGMRPDNFQLPIGARRKLVGIIYGLPANGDQPAVPGVAPDAEAKDVAILASSGERTIFRDKDALGIANPARQAGGVASQAGGAGEGAETGESTPATGDATVTKRKIDTWLDAADTIVPALDEAQLRAVASMVAMALRDVTGE